MLPKIKTAILVFLASAITSSAYGRREQGTYDRNIWPHWVDWDRDCQDERTETLIRDNQGELKFKLRKSDRGRACAVLNGLWLCPYTGKIIVKASQLDIDHIVPLSHAYFNGALGWDKEKKKRFANDPRNLLAVDLSANRQKGGKGPEEWKPPRKEYWCQYAKQWTLLKTEYGLTSKPDEQAALDEMLNTCRKENTESETPAEARETLEPPAAPVGFVE